MAPAEAPFQAEKGSDGAILPSFLKKFKKFLVRTLDAAISVLARLFMCIAGYFCVNFVVQGTQLLTQNVPNGQFSICAPV
ncbi:hypothetical protein [Rothia nasimurium]|uniref:hypothetical protein n=1 Tax=Rothia nasimurium TaxID=85336 RepID=UPI001F1758A9|nr:hypothetical protein [Rothia nasimurium]